MIIRNVDFGILIPNYSDDPFDKKKNKKQGNNADKSQHKFISEQ